MRGRGVVREGQGIQTDHSESSASRIIVKAAPVAGRNPTLHARARPGGGTPRRLHVEAGGAEHPVLPVEDQVRPCGGAAPRLIALQVRKDIVSSIER
jgi:hypothetical protein